MWPSRLLLWLALAAGSGLATAAEPEPQPLGQGQAEAASAPAYDGFPAGFDSALVDYRPYRAGEPLEDWRTANAAVGRAGGHAGHLPAAPEAGQMQHGDHGR